MPFAVFSSRLTITITFGKQMAVHELAVHFLLKKHGLCTAHTHLQPGVWVSLKSWHFTWMGVVLDDGKL